MRFGKIKLVNYIGIFNGLGIHEIAIDFTLCKYNKVIIKGLNGSGKSTLFNALNPLPDKNDCFIPGLPASKYLEIYDFDCLYIIRCEHGVKKNGDRETTKAYLTKVQCGTEEQLNPNGNVNSFYDALQNELNLDPNYMTLTRLSSGDRGLADKKPADRKKFVTSIISSLEVYNNICKTMTKRSSVFRSMINSISSKINNIGSEETITSNLQSLNNLLNTKFAEKDELVKTISSYKSKIELIDPNGDIQNTYNNIYTELVSINNNLTSTNDTIFNLYNKIGLKPSENDNIKEPFDLNKKKIASLTIDIQTYENKIQSLLLEKEEQVKVITKKNSKLVSLNSDSNYRELELAIKQCKEKIANYEEILNGLNIQNINITTDEFILGLNSLKEIKDIIDTFKADCSYDILNAAIGYISNNSYPEVEQLKHEIEQYELQMNEYSIEMANYRALLKVMEKLSLRPSGCNISSCGFIQDALQAEAEQPQSNIDRLEMQMEDMNKLINDKKMLLETNTTIISVINQLNVIARHIQTYSNIFNKLPIRNIFSTKENIFNLILTGYDFNEIQELCKYIDYSSFIDEYSIEKNNLHKLEIDYKIYESKNEMIDELMQDIEDLNSKINTIQTEIDKSSQIIMDLKNELNKCNDIQIHMDNLLLYINKKNELLKHKSEVISKYEQIKTNINIIKESLSNIEIYSKQLELVDKEINPLIEQRDGLKHALIMLVEYNEELASYKAKYEKIEIIKKYSSPTSGIQTLFMELYMNKTLSMANDLISLMFDGRYNIEPYIINDKEFRIPIGREGITNDDISSLSTAEICMISMILSFVLLKQSSTKYNILQLDEIDGGLDTQNRLNFNPLLDKLMGILEVEQCIIISHNSEQNLNNCDVIVLKTTGNPNFDGANIIYKY